MQGYNISIYNETILEMTDLCNVYMSTDTDYISMSYIILELDLIK